MSLRAQLRAVVEPVVGAAGYDLEDLTVSRAGRRSVVRVVVDRDGGIDLDAVADVSRLVSAALDAAEDRGREIFTGEYQLEVSSPGVDRPLTQPRHWRRNVGRLVKVGPLRGPRRRCRRCRRHARSDGGEGGREGRARLRRPRSGPGPGGVHPPGASVADEELARTFDDET